MALRKAPVEPLPLVPAMWMTGAKPMLRVAELAEQALDAAERKVDQPRVQRPQLGQKLVTRSHGAR